MKASELRALSDSELLQKLRELDKELLNLRFQRDTGQLENLRAIRSVRKDRARVLTLLHERRLGINEELTRKAMAIKQGQAVEQAPKRRARRSGSSAESEGGS